MKIYDLLRNLPASTFVLSDFIREFLSLLRYMNLLFLLRQCTDEKIVRINLSHQVETCCRCNQMNAVQCAMNGSAV